MTEKKLKEILDLLVVTRNPYDIAERTNTKLSEVRQVMKREELDRLPGWGKPSLQPYIVSRRKAGWPVWPGHDQQRLMDCQRQHDQGKVTMCQGRDGDWIIQYAIVNRRPVRRAPYFYGG